ncbi:hypothetical protein KEM52_005303 [Ascosphaera acerosa]|nr:hypothetical protein KEM52_005303 [Ascosphaera acerosa]
MKILEPQSAVLSSAEVLAFVTQHPPRKPPSPPPNVASANFVPVPDLRDHNTVVKEFHNYVTRLSPHLLHYPSSTGANESDTTPTPLDSAIRTLITDLKPFGLTKAEVLMILNLGVGLRSEAPTATQEGQDGDVAMGQDQDTAQEQPADEEADDYGALALLDTIIENREERLSDDDIAQILAVIRNALGPAATHG